jgi:hypothetical protein
MEKIVEVGCTMAIYNSANRDHSCARDVSIWQMRDMDPLPTWAKGKAILIGDAAHPSKVFRILPEAPSLPLSFGSAPSSSRWSYVGH